MTMNFHVIFGLSIVAIGAACSSTRETVNPATRTIVQTDAVHVVGPYNPAVIVDKIVYTAGIIGIDVETGELAPGGIIPETEQALKNLGTILDVAGSSFEKVVKVTVVLSDITDWPTVNEIYVQYFKNQEYYPARTAFQAAALPAGAKVEIEAVGIIGPVINNPLMPTSYN